MLLTGPNIRVRIGEPISPGIDREVLALRHFELLSNGETAAVLGLSKTAASNRYIRALGRLRDILEEIPGFVDGL